MSDPLTMTGVTQRQEYFRFDVLDSSLSFVGNLNPIGDRPIVISNDTGRTIRRTLSNLRLTPSDAAAIDPLTNRLRAYCIIDGVSYPLGVFIFADSAERVSSYGNELTASLTDLGAVLDQPLDASVTYNPGANVGTAIEDLAVAAGITSYSIEATSTTVGGASLNFPAGQKTRLSVMNELATLAGFYGGYFDNDGSLIFRTVPELGTVSPSFDWDAHPVVIADSIVESSDVLEAPNRFVVVSSGYSAAAVVGSFDIPDDAPHSIANRGFAVVSVHDKQGIAGSDAADEAARAIAAQTSAYQSVQLQTISDPRFDTFDLVYWSGRNWLSESWRLTLAPGGPMQHELRRTYDE